ncbi:hypothetical protein F5X96DRAFT_623281, partial [Biscogniauxia mediterranea]
MSEINTTSNSPVMVETNNFHQVLTHFNREGHIVNPDTIRLAVSCQICCCKDLAILNDRFDQHSRQKHEAYAVLPRCGHAFGYKCLYEWLTSEAKVNNPQCPSCRASVSCEHNHQLPILEIFGASGASGQHEDVLEIREALGGIACESCGPDAPPRKPIVYVHHELEYARVLISQDVHVDRELLDEQVELFHEKAQQLRDMRNLMAELDQLDEEERQLREAAVPGDESTARTLADMLDRRFEVITRLGGFMESRRENHGRLTDNLFHQIDGLMHVIRSAGGESEPVEDWIISQNDSES